MNEQNNQQPQPQQPYPYSQQPQQPYPYSQQPPQPYSNSQQPYPYSQYQYPQPQQQSEKKGLSVGMTAGIVGGIIFFLIIIFTLLVMVRHQQVNGNNLRDYSAYASFEVPVRNLEVDGDSVTLPQRMLDINDLSYIEIGNFADVLGYDSKSDADNQQVTVTLGDRSVTFTDGNDKAIVRNGNKTTTETMDDKALMFTEEGMYVPLRSMQNIFGLEEVDWNPDTNTVIILTDGAKKPAA